MKLFYFPGACSLADHIVLQWTGLPHEAIRVTPEAIRSDAYLRMNPNGNVPLLQQGDFILTENVAILGYIAEQQPAAGLLGDGTAKGRAEVMRWLAYLNSDVHMAFKPIFSPSRFLPDESQADALAAQARLRVTAHLRNLERQMEGRDWLTGTRSVADPYLFVVLRWAIRKDIALEGFPNLMRFMERMFADPGVFAAIADEEGEPD